jgi:hypothetical protein
MDYHDTYARMSDAGVLKVANNFDSLVSTSNLQGKWFGVTPASNPGYRHSHASCEQHPAEIRTTDLEHFQGFRYAHWHGICYKV